MTPPPTRTRPSPGSGPPERRGGGRGGSGSGRGRGAGSGGAGSRRGGIRLQKVMAEAGIGSRRACEALIEEGRVAVNGEIVRDMPVMIDPRRDTVLVDGAPMERYIPKQVLDERSPAAKQLKVYVMLYKPRATLSTAADEQGRRTVVDVVPHPSGARLYPVGRLDYDTMGLILLTNDGELANRLTHPRYGVEKTYRAVVKGRLDAEARERLNVGVYLADRREGKTMGASRTEGVSITMVKEEAARTILDITLKEGRNRQIRRMLAKLGCPVRKLVRIAMGPVTLRGLKPGEWRDLTDAELRALRQAASGKGPKGVEERALRRSHAMKLGPTRSQPGVDEDVELEDGVEEREPSRGRGMGTGTGGARGRGERGAAPVRVGDAGAGVLSRRVRPEGAKRASGPGQQREGRETRERRDARDTRERRDGRDARDTRERRDGRDAKRGAGGAGGAGGAAGAKGRGKGWSAGGKPGAMKGGKPGGPMAPRGKPGGSRAGGGEGPGSGRAAGAPAARKQGGGGSKKAGGARGGVRDGRAASKFPLAEAPPRLRT
ncbi:MAG: pseudouridine synthase [Planctomycetota bacterium]|nr:pseudouridine synthase [Planctomycetota bacterium]